jgi:hypothetical protein
MNAQGLAKSCVAVLMVLACTSATAGESKIRVHLGFRSGTGDGSATLVGRTIEGNGYSAFETGERVVDVDSGTVIAVGYEYRFSDLMGITFELERSSLELSVMESRRIDLFEGDLYLGDGEDTVSVNGDLAMMPVSVGCNVHVLRRESFELYVGSVISYVFYDEMDIDSWSFLLAAPSGGDPADAVN